MALGYVSWSRRAEPWWTLSIWRVFAGLGIGGMLATINAIAAEFSNTKRRDLSVSVMSLGYPIGTVVGGILAQRLLAVYTWRSVFYLGAICNDGADTRRFHFLSPSLFSG